MEQSKRSVEAVAGKTAVAVVTLLVVFTGAASGQQRHLEFSGRPRLMDCQPVSSRPCFEAALNVVDKRGVPAPISLPQSKLLLSRLTFTVNGEQVQPFYAVGGAATQQVKKRLALILVDISGSMNRRLSTGETRFEAAKSALAAFIEHFNNNGDQVALVPFESHRVDSTIRNAQFANRKSEVLKQLADLPLPQGKNNTGLYSAVDTALGVLGEKATALAAQQPGKPFETTLLVMTDGKNEVLPGDDANLLAAPAGLRQAAASVASARFPVIGIGFGDPRDIDVAAMRQLSTKYFMAGDTAALRQIFSYASTLLDDRILAAFLSPWPDRASMAGRNFEVRAMLTASGDMQLTSNASSFESPQMGLPLFEGKATTAELTSLVEARPEHALDLRILRPVLVFLGLSLILLLLWFWVPRLIWPEQYVGRLPVPYRRRWAAPGQTMFTQRFGAKSAAPQGFSKGSSRGPGLRNVGDATIVPSRLGPRR